MLFYVKNNTLYAYNYDIGNERVDMIPLETTDEITMLKFDLTMEPMKDALYIATYSAIEGGSLRKYYVGNNPDKIRSEGSLERIDESEEYELESVAIIVK